MKQNCDLKILIVDDEDDLRKNLKRHFELDGFTVLTASGGNEALEIVKNNNIDIVITDVRMPAGDGIELLEKIREIDSSIPVVLMITGFASITREEAIKKGAADLLNKPIDFEILEGYIQKQLSIS